jgi:hypothetical protein
MQLVMLSAFASIVVVDSFARVQDEFEREMFAKTSTDGRCWSGKRAGAGRELPLGQLHRAELHLSCNSLALLLPLNI